MLKAQLKELSQVSGEAQTDSWASELSETIHRLDDALLLRECEEELRASGSGSSQPTASSSHHQS